MPIFQEISCSISCVKYMEVVNMNVLFYYLLTIFLISFCLTLFHYIMHFLIKADFLLWKQRFKWFSASFMMKSLLQYDVDQLELVSLLFKVPRSSAFLFCKQRILCLSACFQEFATILIDTFSSCMSSFKEISCFV